MKISFETLGCKVNYYETQVMESLFAQNGYTVVSSADEADIYVINSCTVTAEGDRKTRQLLRRLRRNHPTAVLAVTGCYPQAFPDEALPEADIITGTAGRKRLIELIPRALKGERIVSITEPSNTFEPMSIDKVSDRTRAYIKIQDGCERYCSYCIIPTARGKMRSKPYDQLMTELQGLARAGYREVVLVGINLSCYGADLGSLRLIDAIRLASSTDGIERVRLGSLEPELFTDDEIIAMGKLKKLCPQFHLSLQSGCDTTLERMNRHYTTADYAAIVKKLRAHIDNASITTDIMVGFPGETESEFTQSLTFAESIGFAKAHIFAYSPRPGTVAATLPDQCSPTQKTDRSCRMEAAMQAKRDDFLRSQLGTAAEVLFESEHEGRQFGYTKNYTPVVVESPNNLSGGIYLVQLERVEGEVIVGRV